MIDLVFVIGTSLVVYPFAGLPGYTHPSVPRVLLNYDPVEDFDRPNDVYVRGDCDKSVWELCQKLGWHKELSKLHIEIGGVPGTWGEDDKEPVENVPKGTEEVTSEDAVEALTRELESELRLDKEEDAEVQRLEERDVKKDETPLKPDASDDDDTVVMNKDVESKAPVTAEAPSKDSKEKL